MLCEWFLDSKWLVLLLISGCSRASSVIGPKLHIHVAMYVEVFMFTLYI